MLKRILMLCLLSGMLGACIPFVLQHYEKTSATVLDEEGRVVANAKVLVCSTLFPRPGGLSAYQIPPPRCGYMEKTVTDAIGRFELQGHASIESGMLGGEGISAYVDYYICGGTQGIGSGFGFQDKITGRKIFTVYKLQHWLDGYMKEYCRADRKCIKHSMRDAQIRQELLEIHNKIIKVCSTL